MRAATSLYTTSRTASLPPVWNACSVRGQVVGERVGFVAWKSCYGGACRLRRSEPRGKRASGRAGFLITSTIRSGIESASDALDTFMSSKKDRYTAMAAVLHRPRRGRVANRPAVDPTCARGGVCCSDAAPPPVGQATNTAHWPWRRAAAAWRRCVGPAPAGAALSALPGSASRLARCAGLQRLCACFADRPRPQARASSSPRARLPGLI